MCFLRGISSLRSDKALADAEFALTDAEFAYDVCPLAHCGNYYEKRARGGAWSSLVTTSGTQLKSCCEKEELGAVADGPFHTITSWAGARQHHAFFWWTHSWASSTI